MATIPDLTQLTTIADGDELFIHDADANLSKRISKLNFLLGLTKNVVVQVKTSGTGTYTPTAGMLKVLVICVGGGGGCPAQPATDGKVSGGGGGGTAIKLFTAAEIGASQPYAVGAAASGVAGNTSGLGTANALLQATGGGVGVIFASTTVGVGEKGGLGGIGTLGDLNIQGGPGGRATAYGAATGCGGNGGDSFLGAGGRLGHATAIEQGENGYAYGGGASGGHTPGTANLDVTAGAAGVIYFIEFIG